MDVDSQPNEIIATVIVAVSASIFLFSFCMFGESLTNQFDVLDDKLYQCSWYSFPIGIQRMLITLMSNTQHPATITGYGNIECTRDTFKTVNMGSVYLLNSQIYLKFILWFIIKFIAFFSAQFFRLLKKSFHILWDCVKSPNREMLIFICYKFHYLFDWMTLESRMKMDYKYWNKPDLTIFWKQFTIYSLNYWFFMKYVFRFNRIIPFSSLILKLKLIVCSKKT